MSRYRFSSYLNAKSLVKIWLLHWEWNNHCWHKQKRLTKAIMFKENIQSQDIVIRKQCKWDLLRQTLVDSIDKHNRLTKTHIIDLLRQT